MIFLILIFFDFLIFLIFSIFFVFFFTESDMQLDVGMYLAASPPLFSNLSMGTMEMTSSQGSSSSSSSLSSYRRRPTSFYRSSSTSINQLAVGINNIDFTSLSLPPVPKSSAGGGGGGGGGGAPSRMQLPIRSASVPDISIFARRTMLSSSSNASSSMDLTRQAGLTPSGRLSSAGTVVHDSHNVKFYSLLQLIYFFFKF